MWAIEKDAALRSDFCNLTILEQVPDLDRLKERMLHAVATMPHLGERVVTPPLRLAPPEWRTDVGFDIDYHVRSVALPEPATVRARRSTDQPAVCSDRLCDSGPAGRGCFAPST